MVVPPCFLVIVVVFLPVELDEDVAPFIANLDLYGFVRELVLDFHLLDSFHGGAKRRYYMEEPTTKQKKPDDNKTLVS